jgi:hypothetical protein
VVVVVVALGISFPPSFPFLERKRKRKGRREGESNQATRRKGQEGRGGLKRNINDIIVFLPGGWRVLLNSITTKQEENEEEEKKDDEERAPLRCAFRVVF